MTWVMSEHSHPGGSVTIRVPDRDDLRRTGAGGLAFVSAIVVLIVGMFLAKGMWYLWLAGLALTVAVMGWVASRVFAHLCLRCDSVFSASPVWEVAALGGRPRGGLRPRLLRCPDCDEWSWTETLVRTRRAPSPARTG